MQIGINFVQVGVPMEVATMTAAVRESGIIRETLRVNLLEKKLFSRRYRCDYYGPE